MGKKSTNNKQGSSEVSRSSIYELRFTPRLRSGRANYDLRITIYGLLSSFLLAISPWHIHLSRVESESNLAVLFVTFAALLFLKAVKSLKSQWLLIPSLILLSLSYYTYHGNHLFTSLFIIGILIIYNHSIPRTKISAAASLIFVVLTGFILALTLFSADRTKFSGISIFADPTVVYEKIELPRLLHQNPDSLLAILSHNRITWAIQTISQNYLNAFSPEFLFIKGGTNHAHNIQNFGNLYLVDAPFLLIGLIVLFMSIKNKNAQLILWWLASAPIASSLTKDAPHTNRMFAVFPILPILTSLGIVYVLGGLLTGKNLIRCAAAIIAFLYISNIVLYLDRYYVHFPKSEAQYWGLGYKKLVNLLAQPGVDGQKVIMSHPEYSPYIYLLFYSAYDPQAYQREAVRYQPTQDGFIHVKNFGKFEFRNIDWGRDLQEKNTLLIDYSGAVPNSLQQNLIKEIVLPDRRPFISIIKN